MNNRNINKYTHLLTSFSFLLLKKQQLKKLEKQHFLFIWWHNSRKSFRHTVNFVELISVIRSCLQFTQKLWCRFTFTQSTNVLCVFCGAKRLAPPGEKTSFASPAGQNVYSTLWGNIFCMILGRAKRLRHLVRKHPLLHHARINRLRHLVSKHPLHPRQGKMFTPPGEQTSSASPAGQIVYATWWGNILCCIPAG